MSLQSHIQQPPPRTEETGQVVRALDWILSVFLDSPIHCRILGILDPATAGEAVAFAEYFEELIVCESADTILGRAHLA